LHKRAEFESLQLSSTSSYCYTWAHRKAVGWTVYKEPVCCV